MLRSPHLLRVLLILWAAAQAAAPSAAPAAEGTQGLHALPGTPAAAPLPPPLEDAALNAWLVAWQGELEASMSASRHALRDARAAVRSAGGSAPASAEWAAAREAVAAFLKTRQDWFEAIASLGRKRAELAQSPSVSANDKDRLEREYVHARDGFRATESNTSRLLADLAGLEYGASF